MTGLILVVEDDPKIASLLVDYLRNSAFDTLRASNGASVETTVRANAVDLVILDLALPGMDGIDVCKKLRTFSVVPIVMLTARVDEIDRLLGLELGADDYICKPFSPREVVARVKAILRRTERAPSAPTSSVVMDKASYTATLGGRNLDLTAVEFHLLEILVHHPGRIFSRAQLMDAR
jgi:two-component system response regulator BaeR